ncbi:hypothetical protein H6F96_16810 [Microcoleus sp. FACHB-53]|nr:hypothetical protein [Microcoleus sp. FACHB-53]
MENKRVALALAYGGKPSDFSGLIWHKNCDGFSVGVSSINLWASPRLCVYPPLKISWVIHIVIIHFSLPLPHSHSSPSSYELRLHSHMGLGQIFG